MQTKIYVTSVGDYGETYRTPIEKFKWTGRWQIETIITKEKGPPGYKSAEHPDGMIVRKTVNLRLERWIRLFNIIPLWKVWEHESNFYIREEECTTNQCIGDIPLEGV